MLTKNVPLAERAIRVFGGIVLLILGLMEINALPTGIGYLIAAAGGIAAVTGLAGFCPTCALAGRRIEQKMRDK